MPGGHARSREALTMRFPLVAAVLAAAAVTAMPIVARADVYINSISAGLNLYSIAHRDCSRYSVNSVRCPDGAMNPGPVTIIFLAFDKNGRCAANPANEPCKTGTYCNVFVSRRTGNHYDMKVTTVLGEPSPHGTVYVGPQYTPTRHPCVATWANGNTIDVSAPLK